MTEKRVYTTQKMQLVCTALDLDLTDRRARFKTPDGESHRVSARNIVWIVKANKTTPVTRICYITSVDVAGASVKSIKKGDFLHEAKLDDGSVMMFNPRYHRIADD